MEFSLQQHERGQMRHDTFHEPQTSLGFVWVGEEMLFHIDMWKFTANFVT